MANNLLARLRRNLDYQVCERVAREHHLALGVELGKGRLSHPVAVFVGAERTARHTLAMTPGRPNPHAVRASVLRTLKREGVI